jgi:hypothetical protein
MNADRDPVPLALGTWPTPVERAPRLAAALGFTGSLLNWPKTRIYLGYGDSCGPGDDGRRWLDISGSPRGFAAVASLRFPVVLVAVLVGAVAGEAGAGCGPLRTSATGDGSGRAARATRAARRSAAPVHAAPRQVLFRPVPE